MYRCGRRRSIDFCVQEKSPSEFTEAFCVALTRAARRLNPRQRPTLPRTCARSTIGGRRLNFRVRNGNGCDPSPMATGKLYLAICDLLIA